MILFYFVFFVLIYLKTANISQSEKEKAETFRYHKMCAQYTEWQHKHSRYQAKYSWCRNSLYSKSKNQFHSVQWIHLWIRRGTELKKHKFLIFVHLFFISNRFSNYFKRQCIIRSWSKSLKWSDVSTKLIL